MTNEFLMIFGMMLVTFIPRYGVLALMGKIEMPRPIFRALKFVPPCRRDSRMAYPESAPHHHHRNGGAVGVAGTDGRVVHVQNPLAGAGNRPSTGTAADTGVSQPDGR